jgi:hypothetical protein
LSLEVKTFSPEPCRDLLRWFMWRKLSANLDSFSSHSSFSKHFAKSGLLFSWS